MPNTFAQSLVTALRFRLKRRVARNEPEQKIFYNSGLYGLYAACQAPVAHPAPIVVLIGRVYNYYIRINLFMCVLFLQCHLLVCHRYLSSRFMLSDYPSGISRWKITHIRKCCFEIHDDMILNNFTLLQILPKNTESPFLVDWIDSK